ncbi:YtxH domain-containing protein, partial [Bacillus sp. JJ1521]|uniref:YtxH domain-containing protein n=1 Tax=Bacillus sp. JJ1521 TaxID=3122957 RepID=UPI003000E707
LFLAQKTGQDLRRQINDQASVVKEKTNSLSKTISEQSNQILTKVKDLKASAGQNEPDLGQDSQEPEATASTATTSEAAGGDQPKNDELFQEKLAEAQKALTDAENNTQTTNY